jgi:hypothetical protein
MTAYASSNTVDEINTIKKSSYFLYGDVTMSTIKDADQVARSILQEEMYRWAVENQHQIDSAKIKYICSNADTLMMRRADQYRVFAYVNKGVFFQQQVPQKAKPEEVTPPKEEPTPEVQPIEVEKKEKKDSTLLNDTTMNILRKHFSPKTNKKARIQKGIIQKVMEAHNFFELREIMQPLKESGDIIDYGKYATAKNPSECYLIVYDPAGNIKAWLDKGKDIRKNLKTGKDDSIKNYHGCGAIWFTINENK